MIPSNATPETIRIQDLYAHVILDTPPEPAFDELVELAARILPAPMAALSFVDQKRQWFKASTGLRCKQTRRAHSFCHHTIESNELFVVEDAATDPRFRELPLVRGLHRVRFYAGAPVLSASGQRLGALCIMDTAPRLFTAAAGESLQLLARQAARQLEHRQLTRHIGRELHEEIAQMLAATKLYLEVARKQKDSDLVGFACERLGELIPDTASLARRLLTAFPSTTAVG